MFGGSSNKYTCTAQCEVKRVKVLGKTTAILPGRKSVAVYTHCHGTCEVQVEIEWKALLLNSRGSGSNLGADTDILTEVFFVFSYLFQFIHYSSYNSTIHNMKN
jgi:hypothetical protein